MTTCTVSRIIHVKSERAFDVATKYDAMSESMPDHYVISETKSRRGDVSVVRARFILAGKQYNTLAKHTEHRPYKHEIKIIGGDWRGSYIVETYESLGNFTRLTLSADMGQRRFLILRSGISRKHLKSWLQSITSAIENAASN